MTAIEALNQIADETPDSKNTTPGATLYFCGCSTIGESLKKLQKHNFIIGYAFDIEVNGQLFQRITAYNQKNDIVLAWMGPDRNGEVKFPCRHPSYQSFLYLVRHKGNQTLSLSKERLTSKLCDGAKLVDSTTPHIAEVNNQNWFGDYWPILEHPEVEAQKRKEIFNINQEKLKAENLEQAIRELKQAEAIHDLASAASLRHEIIPQLQRELDSLWQEKNHQKTNRDGTFYQDVATLCNIYRFNETYEMLSPGLQSIYQELNNNREEIFCREVERRSVVDGTIDEMLSMLNMDYQELEEIFERQGRTLPVNNSDFSEADEKISFIKQLSNRVKDSFGRTKGGRQKTKMPNEQLQPKISG